MVRIRRLGHVGLTVSDVATATRFYTEVWGLAVSTRGGDGAIYLRAATEDHHVLALYPGAGRALHHVAFEVMDGAALSEAEAYLRRRGVRVVEGITSSDEPGHGLCLRIADPEGRTVEFFCDAQRVTPRAPAREVYPNRLTHVVLTCGDIDASYAFYTDVIGLRLSDWIEHAMVFLRCDTNHHSLALTAATKPSLQHCAYEVASVDMMMRGIDVLKRHGYECLWGPGRHGPGDNTFAYFVDPAGHIVEYTAEVQQILDEVAWAKKKKVWRAHEAADVTGTAGPPPPRFFTVED